jgi:hypothetical protein
VSVNGEGGRSLPGLVSACAWEPTLVLPGVLCSIVCAVGDEEEDGMSHRRRKISACIAE